MLNLCIEKAKVLTWQKTLSLPNLIRPGVSLKTRASPGVKGFGSHLGFKGYRSWSKAYCLETLFEQCNCVAQ